MPKLTQEYLKAELNYDPETGIFSWRRMRSGRVWGRVGTVSNFGYLVIMLDGQRYMAQRLAWFYMKGVWPEYELDHINRDKLDNKISNLRDIPHGVNIMNSAVRKDSSTKLRGICWDAQKNKWKVQITAPSGTRISRHFVNQVDAINFRCEMASKLYGELAVA